MKLAKLDLHERFGFLVNEVGRLYSRAFDQLARQRLGLSRAQCRLIAVLAAHEGDKPLSQAELAERLDLTPMGIVGLCDRMEAGGWLRRQPSATDRRSNEIALQPAAHEALQAALALSDELQAEATAGLSAAERRLLTALLQRVHANLGTVGAR